MYEKSNRELDLLDRNFLSEEVTIEHWHQQGSSVAAGVVGEGLEQVAS